MQAHKKLLFSSLVTILLLTSCLSSESEKNKKSSDQQNNASLNKEGEETVHRLNKIISDTDQLILRTYRGIDAFVSESQLELEVDTAFSRLEELE